ncbi:MAG: metallophosphoesterase family protein [Spirochaetes bacterium]|nr:metallophosphoesterase family protein [Spirochaetota bacterium]
MPTTTTPKDMTASIGWPLLHCIIASLSAGAVLASIIAAGWELFLVLLATSYGSVMIPAALLLLTLGLWFAGMAASELRGIARSGGYRLSTAKKAGTVMILACLAVLYAWAAVKGLAMGCTDSADPSPAPAVSAGPFLQFGPFAGHRAESPSRSAVIWWTAPPRDEGHFLMVGTAAGPMRRIPEMPGGGQRHQVHLRDLAPGTRYRYRVSDLGDRTFAFVTAPEDGSTAPFRFLCMGDTGNTKKGGDSFSYHSDVCAAAERYYRRITRAPAFTLYLGDQVKQGTDETAWQRFFREAGPKCSGHPCMMTLGNHECLGDRGERYNYFFSHPAYYSFDYGNAHFLVLHPYDGIVDTLDGPLISTGREQYRFARRDLARNRGRRWIIVAIHNPILSTGDYNHNEILMGQYLRLFRQSGVDLVLSGHDHGFDSFYLPGSGGGRGMLAVVAGTGGSALDGYIMSRERKRWKAWYHDRNSKLGLYQGDPVTRKFHCYGELSWGFLDVQICGDTMTVTYLRWLGYDRFLEITGQESGRWKMLPIPEEVERREQLTDPVPVRSFVLTRRSDGGRGAFSAGYRSPSP